MEFPAKVTVITQDPAADYGTNPQTSFRFSPDIDSTSEVRIPLAIPLRATPTMQVAEKLHNILWSQAEDKLERTLTRKHPEPCVNDTFY